jgi:hypothetical protein
MAKVPDRVKALMEKNGLTEIDKPKRTPNHPTKAKVVMAQQDGAYKLIRFGQQGADPVKTPRNKEEKQRQESYRARHNAQDPNPSKLSARYWSNREWK